MFFDEKNGPLVRQGKPEFRKQNQFYVLSRDWLKLIADHREK